MPAYQDGQFPSGAPILTLGAFTYKCNKLTFDRSAEVLSIPDQDGAHSGALSFEGPITGTVELQYANTATPDPNVAAVNSATGVFAIPINNVNTNCFITSVSIEKAQRAPWTATCGFQVKKN